MGGVGGEGKESSTGVSQSRKRMGDALSTKHNQGDVLDICFFLPF